MSDSDFRAFLVGAYSAADGVMRPGAVFYIWHADSEGANFRGAAKDVGWKVRENSVFDMELAFIAALGFLKVDSIKVVSDGIDYEEYEQTISTL